MKILHLYYDIMNLYGEYANVSALERIIENSGENAEIDRLTLGDNADINSYDFIYIGSGTEDNQKLVLKDFAKYKESLAQFIDRTSLCCLQATLLKCLAVLLQIVTEMYMRVLGFLISSLLNRTSAGLLPILSIQQTFWKSL